MTVAVYPGTFDPFTRGHEDLVRRASSIFDELIVGVASSRSKHPFFTFEEQMPEGTSEERATSLANILNHASREALWQKVGFGTWYA